MRFLFAGYAIIAAFELAAWLYGIEQTVLAITLQFWIGGAALGLFLAWRWFVQEQLKEDQRKSMSLPLVPSQNPMGKKTSVARDISPIR